MRGGRTVALLFVTPYLPLMLGAALLLYAMLEVAVERHRFELAARETSQVAVASQVLAQDFADFSSDLMVLARAPLLRRYLDDGAEAERVRLVEAFLGLAQEKQSYDQIRLLGEDGMELIRINFADGRAWEVPRAERQPKGGRYFFKDAIRLARGEIYVSPLDLNIEHGAIELPHKPMRSATARRSSTAPGTSAALSSSTCSGAS